MSAARGPTDNIIAKDDDGKWHEVGVAWRNESGSITLKFNPFTDLARIREAETVMVSPRSRTRVAGAPVSPSATPQQPPDDSDIPF